MLNIILGRSGSGKTEYVQEILGEKAKAGENKLLLIVPEQFSYSCERAMLEKFSPIDANKVEVLSFTRLVDYINRETGGMAGTYADDSSKLILMLHTLNELNSPEIGKLSFYKKHVKNVPLCQQLIKLVGEFHMQKITPDMLESASKLLDGTLKKKIYELSLIYRTYDAKLSQQFLNDDTALDTICEKIALENSFNGYTIAIDSFKGFTAQEFDVLTLIFRQAKDVYLTLCLDESLCKAKELDTAAIFDSVKTTYTRIQQIAKKEHIEINNVPTPNPGIRFKTAELDYLEKNLFSAEVKPYSKSSDNITLCIADNKRIECAYIAATIKKLIRTEDLRLSNIAVIVRDENEYKRELVAAFNRYGVPVFEDVRQPIINQPVIALTRALLQILTGGFSTDNILNYLKTGLSPVSMDHVSLLENYALIWDLKASAWEKGFTNMPSGLREAKRPKDVKENEDILNQLNKDRESIINPLTALRESVNKSTNGEEISKSIYDFLISTNVPKRLKAYSLNLFNEGYKTLAAEQDKVWQLLMDLLGKLGTVSDEDTKDVKIYKELFDAVVSTTDLGSIPHGLDEVTIGSADRVRLSSPKVVFLAGCAESVFPAAISSNGLLSFAEREELANHNIELSQPVHELAAEERFIAYQAATSASEKLFVSYFRTSGAKEGMSPSIIFNSIAHIFKTSEVDGKEVIDAIDTSLLPLDYLAETESTTFISLAESIPKASNDDWSLLNSMRKVVEDKGSYRNKLEAIDQITNRKPRQIEDKEIATALFKKDMGISASRVETYSKCPFGYFCKYGLGAMPREKAEITPAISGTVIHYILEQIINEVGKDGLLKASEDEKHSLVDKWLKEYIDNKLNGEEDKTSRFIYLYKRLSVQLYDMLDRLCHEFELTDFVPKDFELALTRDPDEDGIKPYHLDFGENGSIDIWGSIDRVDLYEHEGTEYVRIIDYKSGGKEFKLSDILYGLNLQMLIYLFAVEQNGGERYGTVSPAGILYYPAKKNYISKARKDEDATAKKQKEDRENGLYRSEGFILEAMENGQNEIFIPLTSGRGKKPSDALVTVEQLGLIHKRIDKILEDMLINLHNGNIPVFPTYKSSFDNACEYCDYHAVCGFEVGDEQNVIKNKDAEEVHAENLKDFGGDE